MHSFRTHILYIFWHNNISPNSSTNHTHTNNWITDDEKGVLAIVEALFTPYNIIVFLISMLAMFLRYCSEHKKYRRLQRRFPQDESKYMGTRVRMSIIRVMAFFMFLVFALPQVGCFYYAELWAKFDREKELDHSKNHNFCLAQGMAIQLIFMLIDPVSVGITVIMAMNIIRLLFGLRYKKYSYECYCLIQFVEISIYIFSAGFSQVMTILPLALGWYGDTGLWCWLSDRNASFSIYLGLMVVLILIAVIYSIPSVLGCLYVFIEYRKFRRRRGGSRFAKKEYESVGTCGDGDDESDEVARNVQLVASFILFPPFFILVWIWPFINRVLNFSDKFYLSFLIIHMLAMEFHPTINFLSFIGGHILCLKWVQKRILLKKASHSREISDEIK